MCQFIPTLGGRKILAVGYVFELSNAYSQFDICANITGSCDWLHKLPATDDDRWNSGDFEYPAGLLKPGLELGEEWAVFFATIHQTAELTGTYDSAKNTLVEIRCKSIALVASTGIIVSLLRVDYNVASVDDPCSIVAVRHRQILRAIEYG